MKRGKNAIVSSGDPEKDAAEIASAEQHQSRMDTNICPTDAARWFGMTRIRATVQPVVLSAGVTLRILKVQHDFIGVRELCM